MNVSILLVVLSISYSSALSNEFEAALQSFLGINYKFTTLAATVEIKSIMFNKTTTNDEKTKQYSELFSSYNGEDKDNLLKMYNDSMELVIVSNEVLDNQEAKLARIYFEMDNKTIALLQDQGTNDEQKLNKISEQISHLNQTDQDIIIKYYNCSLQWFHKYGQGAANPGQLTISEYMYPEGIPLIITDLQKKKADKITQIENTNFIKNMEDLAEKSLLIKVYTAQIEAMDKLVQGLKQIKGMLKTAGQAINVQKQISGGGEGDKEEGGLKGMAKNLLGI